MHKITAFVGVAAILFCLSGTAFAGDIYVSKTTGKNSNPGTPDQPIKLLWKAMGKLKSGDRLHVAEGTYVGRKKTGLMPGFKGLKDVVIEGGWKADFSERDPFKYLTIIGSVPTVQPPTGTVFNFDGCSEITLDGFMIDRGIANFYYGDGEPGANNSIEGYVRDSQFGYQAINRKKSGSDTTIILIGRGSFTVRNMVLVNNPWWGIYVKGGGTGTITIENNLILISQGRGIEAITGGGWGKPTWVIRNNTVAFNYSLGSTEGRALSLDPRNSNGKYIVENNVLAFSDGSGVANKFGAKGDWVTITGNKFYFNRRGDWGEGGNGVANAEDFEDELEIDNAEDNSNELPKFLAVSSKSWFDRYSMREFSMLAGTFNTWDQLKAARAALGLGAYEIPGYDQKYETFMELPQSRNKYSGSRYPHPMKKGEEIDWKTAILPIIGSDGSKGIQPFQK